MATSLFAAVAAPLVHRQSQRDRPLLDPEATHIGDNCDFKDTHTGYLVTEIHSGEH